MKGLQAIGLTVSTADATLVEPVDFHLQPGQPLTLLGETGSGKSLLAQAVMGILPETLQASGTLIINGQRYQLPQDRDAIRSLWGRTMASLPQEPWLALDPTMAIQQQVEEGYRYIRGHSAPRSVAASQDDLAQLGLQVAAQKFPWQLSGGMAQRAAFAAARSGGAEILIADEPTKGLDVSRRDDVSALLRREVAEGGTLLTITHDIALARQLGGDVIVMHKGKVIEQGTAQQVLHTPQQSYTRELLAADPVAWPQRQSTVIRSKPVVSAQGIKLQRGGNTLGVPENFTLHAGEIVGLHGASGSGKSSFGDVLLGLLAPQQGSITRHVAASALKYQKIYQDPSALFPPMRTLSQSLEDVLRRHRIERSKRDTLMEQLALDPSLLTRCPDSLSGGELQRFSLLRVMLLEPVFLFADEPTSRLDPLVQQQTLQLITQMARHQQCGVLLVSHDRELLEKGTDRVIAMQAA
ncbi:MULTISPECIES: ABC transporter ATP-binding protein [unclassified Pantoea]|uniref:ABC transporter ATP-binding protein n=1 Tax=unclassified Pantoea TaxID=2630326 RepID=UPI001CD2BB7F|nr:MULTISPECIES: ATP-binding cassette domain-containing protein [unclassified Pantoea]MCA1177457.1 ATP-binding cassette domain-containing protein [Pantoea sp. alder69]MCA1249637.1 ATP-binding cassette domain-containing protein [Pantoea sp. alder70]MCA1265946.1 ATP-binding cassette domain-containing protein [Pantoea sp. alder81]